MVIKWKEDNNNPKQGLFGKLYTLYIIAAQNPLTSN